MLCYDVSNYDCCGMICINHDDNLLEKKMFINQYHLTRIKHTAWKCYCISTCSGKKIIVLKKQLKFPILGYSTMAKLHKGFLNLTE